MLSSRHGSKRDDTCGICLDTLTDPRELTCVHAFCLVCLTSHIEYARQDYGTTFKCPLCRREFQIPRERISEDIAKDFRRKIQRGKINDSSRHLVAFTRGNSKYGNHSNKPANEIRNVSRNIDHQRNLQFTRLPYLNAVPEKRRLTNFGSSFRELNDLHLPSIINPNMAQAPVTNRNFIPEAFGNNSFLLPPSPDSGNLDDEFCFPSTPDSGNPNDQFYFPITPDLFEANNSSLFTEIPDNFPSNENFRSQNRINSNRIPTQQNLFEPRGINIVNVHVRNVIVQDSASRQAPRQPSPKGSNGLNRNIRLAPISPLQRPSNEATIKSSDMPHDMEQDAINCVVEAADRFIDHIDIAGYVKREFDRKNSQTWHCIVGTSFGSYVTHENNCFVYFKIRQVFVLLFKAG